MKQPDLHSIHAQLEDLSKDLWYWSIEAVDFVAQKRIVALNALITKVDCIVDEIKPGESLRISNFEIYCLRKAQEQAARSHHDTPQ